MRKSSAKCDIGYSKVLRDIFALRPKHTTKVVKANPHRRELIIIIRGFQAYTKMYYFGSAYCPLNLQQY